MVTKNEIYLFVDEIKFVPDKFSLINQLILVDVQILMSTH